MLAIFYLQVTPILTTKFGSVHLLVQENKFKIDFQDGGHVGLLIETIFAIFDTDDTSLACSSENMPGIKGILNLDLLVLSTWRKQWLVDFHPSKTEAIIFSCNDAYHFPNLMFEDVFG